MAQAKKAPKPIQDVAHPNTSAADATAKPVLITNRPLMTDPMVKVEGGDLIGEPAKDDKEPAKLKHSITVEPLSAPEIPGAKPVEEVKEETKEPEPKIEVKSDDQPQESVAKPKTKEEPPVEQPKEQPEETKDDTPVPEKADEKTEENTDQKAAPDSKEKTAPEIDEAEKKKQEEHDNAIAALVESKKYYLPINTIEKRRSKNHVVLGILLSLILVVAWGDVALDSGLVSNSSNLPHTHFFSNVTTPTTTAPSTPTTTFSKYTFAASSLKIKYPSKWVVSSIGSSSSDQVSLTPPANTAATKSATGAIKVEFTSNAVATPSAAFLVKSVSYKQLPKTTANPVYIRDMVYLNQADNSISVSSSLTNSKVTKAGDTLSTLSSSFSYNSSSANNFIISVTKATSGLSGFKNTTLANNFMSSTPYLQARSILLSLSN